MLGSNAMFHDRDRSSNSLGWGLPSFCTSRIKDIHSNEYRCIKFYKLQGFVEFCRKRGESIPISVPHIATIFEIYLSTKSLKGSISHLFLNIHIFPLPKIFRRWLTEHSWFNLCISFTSTWLLTLVLFLSILRGTFHTLKAQACLS